MAAPVGHMAAHVMMDGQQEAAGDLILASPPPLDTVVASMFSERIFEMMLVLVLIAAGTVFLAWILPLLLRWLFVTILGVELYYDPLSHDATQLQRSNYLSAPYLRTHLFRLLYQTVRVTTLLFGLWFALWLLSYDLWGIVVGLGIGTFIVIFHLADYIQNAFAYFSLHADPSRSLSVGDEIEVDGHFGVLMAIGLQRAQLRYALPPLPHHQQQQHEPGYEHAGGGAFYPTLSSPSRSPSALEAGLIPRYADLFVPTAALTRNVVRHARPIHYTEAMRTTNKRI